MNELRRVQARATSKAQQLGSAKQKAEEAQAKVAAVAEERELLKKAAVEQREAVIKASARCASVRLGLTWMPAWLRPLLMIRAKLRSGRARRRRCPGSRLRPLRVRRHRPSRTSRLPHDIGG